MKLKRILAILLAATLLLGLLAGCGKDEKTEQNDTKAPSASSTEDETIQKPKFAYKASYTPLTTHTGENLEYVQSFCLSGEKLLYVGSYMTGEEPVTNPETGEPIIDQTTGEPAVNQIYEDGLFQMDLATKEVSLMELPPAAEIPEGYEGRSYIQTIFAGVDGDVWLLRQNSSWTYDLPENFDASTDDMWNYYTEGDQSTELLRFSKDGTAGEAVAFELPENVYINELMADKDGNFYAYDYNNVYVFSAEGKLLQTISNDGNMDQMVQLSEGQVGMICHSPDYSSRSFRPIDPKTGALGEEMSLIQDAYNLYPGFGEYAYLYSDSSSIFGVKEGEDKGEKLLSWLDCDVDSNNLNNGEFAFLEDGRVVAVERNRSGEASTNLIILEQVDPATLPQKKELTLACFGLDWDLRPMIVNFNRANDSVRIVVKDYSEYATEEDYYAGLTKLNTEILSGNIPDLLGTNGMPLQQFAAKGLLTDLWPLIDSDPELSREDLMTHLFETMSIDGKLYHITNTFSIQTAGVNSAIADGRTSWTLDEVLEAMEGLQPGASIFDETTTKDSVLQYCIGFNLDSLMNWAEGTCNFNDPAFIDLLNFCNEFPAETDPNYDWSTAESEYSRLNNGKQLMSTVYLSSFEDLQVQAAYHGGKVTFIGFPSESGKGSCFQLGSPLAISTSCQDTDAAWSFVREILLEENQTSEHVWNFPTNAKAFEKYKEKAMTPQYQIDPETGEQVEVSNMGYGIGNDFTLDIYAMKQEEYDTFMELYENCTTVYSSDEEIMSVITEECEPFFAGQRTAENAASIIQDRLSVYMAEQG